MFFQHLDMSCMKKIKSRKCNAYDIISRIVGSHKIFIQRYEDCRRAACVAELPAQE